MSEAPSLESILERALTDPSCRLQFYKQLLLTDIYFLGKKNGDEDVSGERKITVVYWQKQDGTYLIPFFSSMEQLSKAIQQEESYLCLNARIFFECTEGSAYVLNPASQFGKEFGADEIAALLDGSLLKNFEIVTIKQGSKIFIGQPANYPDKLIEQLIPCFRRNKEVLDAYVVQISEEESGSGSRLCIVINTQGEMTRVLAQASAIVKAELNEDEFVDFMRLSDSETMQEFVIDQKPFYSRARSRD
jgi:hypothetical protein